MRTNTLYTVNIYDENHASAPVQLTGADNPFETQEDDNEDVFAPLRTQTGYLRIVDTGKDNDGNPFNWREFIPTTDIDRPVTLTDEEGTVLWMGFMQAQNFGSRLYEVPQEREFPLQCPLTVTSCTDVDITQKHIRNFAYLLKKVVDSIPSVCRPTQFLIQHSTTDMNPLLKRIDWQNFVTENNDGDLEPRFSMYECLEELCRFWGWTARICGTTLYLVSPDYASNPSFIELTDTELTDMVGGEAAGTVSYGFTPAGFGSDIFASIDNDDYQMRGPNKAVVTADSGKAEDNVLEIYPLKVLYEMYDLGFVNPGHVQYDYTTDMSVISHHFLSGNCSANASFNVLRIYKTDTQQDKEELIPVIRIKQDYNGTVLASLETNFWHSYYDGYLHLMCEIYKDGEKFQDYIENYPNYGRKRMRMRLGIGATRRAAAWWDGFEWVDNVTTFIAHIGGQDDIIWTEDADTGVFWPEIPTNWPPIKYTQYGKIFVDFLGSGDLTGGFDIASFKIQFERTPKSRDYRNPDREGKHEFTATGEDIIHDNYETETIFTTYEYSVFGFGVVLNEKFLYYRFGKPEQNLANRIINYWRASRRKIDCELRSDKIIRLTPRVAGIIDGTGVYPLSVSHNWRDDVEGVVFIELPELNAQTAASSSENIIEQNDIDQ